MSRSGGCVPVVQLEPHQEVLEPRVSGSLHGRRLQDTRKSWASCHKSGQGDSERLQFSHSIKICSESTLVQAESWVTPRILSFEKAPGTVIMT